jgi:hypothetical protein
MNDNVLTIKVDIDKNNNHHYTIQEGFSADEEMIICLAEIINRLIIDNNIRLYSDKVNLPLKEQEKIVIHKRNLLFDEINKLPIDMNYIRTNESTSMLDKELIEYYGEGLYETPFS